MACRRWPFCLGLNVLIKCWVLLKRHNQWSLCLSVRGCLGGFSVRAQMWKWNMYAWLWTQSKESVSLWYRGSNPGYGNLHPTRFGDRQTDRQTDRHIFLTGVHELLRDPSCWRHKLWYDMIAMYDFSPESYTISLLLKKNISNFNQQLAVMQIRPISLPPVSTVHQIK